MELKTLPLVCIELDGKNDLMLFTRNPETRNTDNRFSTLFLYRR